jgi:[Skp1-protein]-hydroxyproline N-acetylglucosaminyltransferase
MNKVFISIASYRDPELPKTVENLILNAFNPELLRIVVFEQNDDNDPSIYGIYPIDQVLVLQIHYLKAKGPVWARYIIQKEYRDEEYYMQIDSHMRFVDGWDSSLKHMIRLVPEPGVLTQYPPEYTIDGNYDKTVVRSGLYIQGFSPEDGFTRIQSNYTRDSRNFPYTSKAWSACFSFSKGDIVKDAPYDPDLKFLFFGEELDITLRLFTRGYYFYCPHTAIVFTLFDRKYRRTYWQDINKDYRNKEEQKSRKYLLNRIYGPVGETANDHYYCNKIYELGLIRTIKDYEKFANIESLIHKKLSKNAKAFRKKTNKILLK